MKLSKLKNCYYSKIKDEDVGGHYFEIYDLDKNHVTDVLLWDSVKEYNNTGKVQE